MLAIEREVLGAEHPEVAASLAWLAGVYAEREDFAAAREARREVLALRVKLHGEEHWQVTDAAGRWPASSGWRRWTPTSAGGWPRRIA